MPKVIMPKDHPQAAVVLPTGDIAERGKPTEVDDDLAAALEEQGWTQSKAAPAKAAAKKSAHADQAPKGDPQPASPDADTKES